MLNVIGNTVSNKDFFNDEIENRFQAFKSQMNNFKAYQTERIITGKSSSFQNLLYLSQFDYCERIVLKLNEVSNGYEEIFHCVMFPLIIIFRASFIKI